MIAPWYCLTLTDAEKDALFAYLWPAALDDETLAPVVSRLGVIEAVGTTGDVEENDGTT